MLVDPGVGQHVLGRQAVLGLLAKQASDQAFGPGRYRVRDVERPPPNLGKQPSVLLTVEWVPATKMNI